MSHPLGTIEEIEAKYGPVIAIIHGADCVDGIYDYALNWESAQSYALEGYRVTAVKEDGGMTVEEQQRLYDAERERHNDCFGVTN